MFFFWATRSQREPLALGEASRGKKNKNDPKRRCSPHSKVSPPGTLATLRSGDPSAGRNQSLDPATGAFLFFRPPIGNQRASLLAERTAQALQGLFIEEGGA